MKLLSINDLPEELKLSFLGKAHTHYLSRGTNAENLRVNYELILIM